MDDQLKMAVNQKAQAKGEIALINLYPFLPGGENQQLDMDALDKKYKKYVEDEQKKLSRV